MAVEPQQRHNSGLACEVADCSSRWLYEAKEGLLDGFPGGGVQVFNSFKTGLRRGQIGRWGRFSPLLS